jgi:hypothetical protein
LEVDDGTTEKSMWWKGLSAGVPGKVKPTMGYRNKMDIIDEVV